MSENYLSREKIYLIPLLILAASYVFGFRIIAIVMFNTINIRTVDSIDVRLPLFTLGGMPIILAFLLVFISAVIFPFDSKQIIDIKIFGRLFLLGIAFYLFGIPLIMNIIFRLSFFDYGFIWAQFPLYSSIFALGATISIGLGTLLRRKIKSKIYLHQ